MAKKPRPDIEVYAPGSVVDITLPGGQGRVTAVEIRPGLCVRYLVEHWLNGQCSHDWLEAHSVELSGGNELAVGFGKGGNDLG